MTAFDEYTHYEILDLPANASLDDIRKAYKESLSLYDSESLSTYSLFTSLEREKILVQVKSAFQILGDVEKRKAYDKVLRKSGRLSPEMLP